MKFKVKATLQRLLTDWCQIANERLCGVDRKETLLLYTVDHPTIRASRDRVVRGVTDLELLVVVRINY